MENMQTMNTQDKDFFNKYATLFFGVDAALGADSMSESGADRWIVDYWVSGDSAPSIYTDSMSVDLRNIGGVEQGREGQKLAQELMSKYDLANMSNELLNTKLGFDGFLGRNIKALRAMLGELDYMVQGDFLSRGSKNRLMRFEALHQAGLGDIFSYPQVHDPRPERNNLRTALEQAGYPVQDEAHLRDVYLKWRQDQKSIDPAHMKSELELLGDQMLQDLKNNVLSRLDLGISLDELTLEGHTFNIIQGVSYTGFSAYYGGEKRGVPEFKGLFEYNSDHELNATELIHLESHEVIGHYLVASVMDRLWRKGDLGYESTIGSMCTPSCGFHEGWAERMLDLTYGSREEAVKKFGPDLGVVLASGDLENIGKRNASIIKLYKGMTDEVVQDHLRDECILSDQLVKKLSGAWASDAFLGAMYGPAYQMGSTMVAQAIYNHGPLAVAQAGFHMNGMLDVHNFNSAVKQSVASPKFK